MMAVKGALRAITDEESGITIEFKLANVLSFAEEHGIRRAIKRRKRWGRALKN
jgi:hypothetical protein